MGSLAKAQRVNITLQKEQELKSYEDAKNIVTSELLEIDKQINWTSHFYGDDSVEEQKVLRCSHCGTSGSTRNPV